MISSRVSEMKYLHMKSIPHDVGFPQIQQSGHRPVQHISVAKGGLSIAHLAAYEQTSMSNLREVWTPHLIEKVYVKILSEYVLLCDNSN